MSDSAPHDWFRPRLTALVAEAEAAGFAQDVSVAVITDLMNGPVFSAAPAPEIDEDWNRDIGQPEGEVNQAIGRDLNIPDQDVARIGGLPSLGHGRPMHHDRRNGGERL
jgi:hypothetical protein